jgi:hypothetical protein
MMLVVLHEPWPCPAKQEASMSLSYQFLFALLPCRNFAARVGCRCHVETRSEAAHQQLSDAHGTMQQQQ